MSKTDINNYLVDGEEILFEWQGNLLTDINEEKTKLSGLAARSLHFVATDRRLIYLSGEGDFKDIEYGHISSIEAEAYSFPFRLLASAIGVLGGFFLLIGLVSLDTFGLLFPILGIGLLSVAYWFYNKASDANELQRVRIITGDEIDNQIRFQTDENVGAELSRLVRNS